MSIGYSQTSNQSKRIFAIIALMVAIVATATLYTQLIARAFGYSDTLGAPIFWKIYFPWKGVTWYLLSGSDYPALFARQLNLSLSAGGLLFGVCILILLVYKPITKGNKSLGLNKHLG